MALPPARVRPRANEAVPRAMSLAVIATGTEVGKTVVSALLLARYGSLTSLSYWKPVATGASEGRDSETVARLAGSWGEVIPESYLFPEPLSPHLAARRAGGAIDLQEILAAFERLRAEGRLLVVEGIGGLLVPLDDAGTLLADFLSAARLPAVVVAHSGLGTINHTLLTLEAMRARRLEPAAVVLNGPPNPENRRAIERLGRVPVLELAPLAPLDQANLERAAAGFDPEALLAPLLAPRPERRRQRRSAPSPAPVPPPVPSGDPVRPAAPPPAPPPAISPSPFPAPPWIEADKKFVWHPYTQMATAPAPLAVERAEGVYLHTTDGRRVLDAISSWWVNIHGHSHPRLNRALAAQAERMAQIIFAGCAHEPAARLAEELVRRAPGELPHVFFSDDGSTAVEVALKMAYQHWRNLGEPGRTLFVAFDDAYHGDTFGAMAAGGAGVFHDTFRGLFCEVRRAATPASAGCPGASPPLAEVLARDGGRVAAVILEPMLQGAGGMRVQSPAFLRQVRELTRRHGIPLIADEVLTGFGRTGRMFACEHGPIVPDLLCLSKALTAGYLPLAATLASTAIYRSFLSADRSRTLFHGHSYTANALACAVALESLVLFDEEDRLARIGALERLFAGRLAELARHPRVAATRHLGGMAALEIRSGAAGGPDRATADPPPASAGSTPATAGSGGAAGEAAAAGYLAAVGPRLAAECLARGVLLRPLGDVLYVLPPYVISDAEAHHLFDVIAQALDAI
jgi:adenosylmethionine-8-amino-7-oxononanoate aminotransferase